MDIEDCFMHIICVCLQKLAGILIRVCVHIIYLLTRPLLNPFSHEIQYYNHLWEGWDGGGGVKYHTLYNQTENTYRLVGWGQLTEICMSSFIICRVLWQEALLIFSLSCLQSTRHLVLNLLPALTRKAWFEVFELGPDSTLCWSHFYFYNLWRQAKIGLWEIINAMTCLSAVTGHIIMCRVSDKCWSYTFLNASMTLPEQDNLLSKLLPITALLNIKLEWPWG